MRELLDRKAYLDHCSRQRHSFAENLPVYGVILVVVLCMVDLVLTLVKIAEGPFVDANPIAQSIIDSGFYAGLILLKLSAVSLFSWTCIKNRDLLITKVGVAVAAVAHILLTFHWTVMF